MYADELKLKMFRTLTLFFLFSVTPTLVLPTKCDVNFNTSSMLLDCSRSSVDSDHSAYVARKLDDVSENKTVSNITRACSDGGSCIIDATSQSSASPVSPPNLKAPPPSSRPRARRFRSISLSPATAPAPAPESMFRYPDGHFDRSELFLLPIHIVGCAGTPSAGNADNNLETWKIIIIIDPHPTSHPLRRGALLCDFP
ncbi:hypothetical protein PHAVU_004G155400 [Phaseolus vulgaris]